MINSVKTALGSDGSGLQLEKVGQLFQVLPVYFREVAKKLDHSSLFLQEKTFSSRSCKSNSCTNQLLCKIFGHFDQNGRDSAPLTPAIVFTVSCGGGGD